MFFLAGPAFAACTQDATTATCTGDFSAGLVVQNEVATDTETVDVNSLTANVPFIAWTPAENTATEYKIVIDTGSFQAGSSDTATSAASLALTASKRLQRFRRDDE